MHGFQVGDVSFQLLSYFVIDVLDIPGIQGLFVAVLLSAAMR